MLYLEAKIIYNHIKRKFVLFLVILLEAIRNEKITKSTIVYFILRSDIKYMHIN